MLRAEQGAAGPQAERIEGKVETSRGTPGGSFEASAPKVLFNPNTGSEAINTFDVSFDGRFLMTSLTQQAANPITVVVNWQPALGK
jgi:hypothetical protein